MDKILQVFFSLALIFNLCGGAIAETTTQQVKISELRSGAEHITPEIRERALKYLKEQQRLTHRSCHNLGCWGKCMQEANLLHCCEGTVCIGTCDPKCLAYPSGNTSTAATICFAKCLL